MITLYYLLKAVKQAFQFKAPYNEQDKDVLGTAYPILGTWL